MIILKGAGVKRHSGLQNSFLERENIFTAQWRLLLTLRGLMRLFQDNLWFSLFWLQN